MADQHLSPETLAAQAPFAAEGAVHGLVPPIYPATAYERLPDGSYTAGRVYTRSDNPTYDPAEQLIAALEGGVACALFSSGNAASIAIFQCLLPGDHVLVARILYWGIRKWLAEFAVSWGLDVEFVDTTDPSAVAAAIRPGKTRLLWLETPSNPTWEITDLRALCEIAHRADVRVAVDNTVPTPVLTRPIEHGADLVVHSATKYLNGHSDVLAGAVVTARPDPFWERIRSWRRNAGSVLGPFEAWLLQRGMRTLFVRVRRSSETALEIARHFEGHEGLVSVLYPGLPSHPGHGIAARQMSGGFGGMLSIRVKGGAPASMDVAARLRVFQRTTSLGGVESLVEHRKSVEGPSSPVPDDLLRLSIGLEAPADLIADLEQALGAAKASRPAAVPAPAQVAPPAPAANKLVSALEAVLERSVAPLVIARGGAIRLASASDGIVTLEASGSPGAILPMTSHIETLVREAIPGLREVRFVWPQAARTAGAAESDLAEQVRRVLDEEINPAVAAHRGKIDLVDVRDGTVHLRLEGGCQGCSLAAVTVRQGVEPLLRARFPDLAAVVDETDHPAGTEPFFTPAKR